MADFFTRSESLDQALASVALTTLLAARLEQRYVFLHGFAKGDRANITPGERKALQYAGKVFLDLSPVDLESALQTGVLIEVDCGEQID